ncbi:hypothetical protein SAMN05216419_102919 [Nitrosomonas cryotolerans]|nr:hypothetical protein SAMN05216419_102919 [Nitrosomonas cryotolerans]
MKFNEDSRVKIPAILHLIRLGYNYLSLKAQTWDLDTNFLLNDYGVQSNPNTNILGNSAI